MITCSSDGLTHCLVLYLGELALFIDEGDDVHGFVGDHVQSILVVCELDVLPADVLQVVLLLLQFEDVTDEELLQVLVGEVDAQLLKTAGRRATRDKNTVTRREEFRSQLMFLHKFHFTTTNMELQETRVRNHVSFT